MRVAITGATGFIGRHLVRNVAAAGHDVVAVCRSPRKASDLPAEVRQADLADQDALIAAVRGCDAMIANAALSPGHDDPAPEAFIEANVKGAEHQLQAALAAGVDHLVWISTIAVYRTRLFVAQDEASPRIHPEASRFDWNNLTTHPMYAASKARAERRVWEVAHQHGLGLTVFRPGPVYGPGDAKLTLRYARKLTRPVATAATVRVPHVHAEDVALAVTAALERQASGAFNLAGSWVSPFGFLRTWRSMLSVPTMILPVPVPVAVRLDDRRARRVLDWQPRSLEAAMPGLCEAFFDTHGGLR